METVKNKKQAKRSEAAVKPVNGSSAKKLNGVLRVKNATVKEFASLKNISGYTNEELAALVGITHRTIRNNKGNSEIFNIAQTERLRKLNKLFAEGNEIFGNRDQFGVWLQKPSYGLDYSIPAELLTQPGGLDIVMNELNSIKFGDAI